MATPADDLTKAKEEQGQTYALGVRGNSQDGVAVEGEAGHERRQFSLFAILGLAFAVLNSWTAIASSLNVAIPSGGSTVVIYGLLVAFVGNFAMTLSLAEIAHVYPLSGGQMHYTACLAPPDWAPLLSWTTGWFAVAGWIALFAANPSLAAQLITGMLSLNYPGYVVQSWHILCIYIVVTVGASISFSD